MTAHSHPRFHFRAAVLFVMALFPDFARAQVLPPPAIQQPVPAKLFVRAYEFEGNTVVSDADLTKVTAPFANREITSEGLEEARRAVTLLYIDRGYINSGAILPDQDPQDGMVTIRIVEGVLSKIEVHGNKWLCEDYVRPRVRRWSGPPLNMNELKEGLQLLRQNPNVTRVNAELKPGATPGESILDLRVEDQQPYRAGLEINNHRPPSTGAEEISAFISDLNVTGHSDVVDFWYGIANSGVDDGWGFSGVDNLAGSYLLPLNRYETSIRIQGSRLNTSIIEEPVSVLGIDSETVSYGVVLRQPIYRTANQELALAIAFDRSQNDTTELGQPYSISPGAVNGRMIVSALRLSQEWTGRGPSHVLALRSTFNIGLDVLDATDDGISGSPDGTFFSWVGQAQYVRRLFNTQNELIWRLTGQWTDDKLLAMEQLSIGGSQTVRGYRENQLVRDRGIVSSIELRLPILFDKTGAGIVHIAPFFDFGGAWNVGDSPSPTTIYSTGVGLLLTPCKYVDAELYWGYRLRQVDVPYDDPQDLGLHFRVRVMAF